MHDKFKKEMFKAREYKNVYIITLRIKKFLVRTSSLILVK